MRFGQLLMSLKGFTGIESMTQITVDYYLTITSPWTFLGHDEFATMAKQAGAVVNVKPVDFGAVFAVSGGLPLPKRSLQRQRYRMFELQRWRRQRDIPLNLNPAHFPVDPTLGNNSVLAAREMDLDAMTLASKLMYGVWCEEKNVSDAAFIRDTAKGLGMDGDAILASAESDEIKALSGVLTEEAKAAQVFGAPSYVINGELWWGQDRLEFVRGVLLEGVESLPDVF
jgi:2-hydroxychromene-2-carboxylate isomerase